MLREYEAPIRKAVLQAIGNMQNEQTASLTEQIINKIRTVIQNTRLDSAQEKDSLMQQISSMMNKLTDCSCSEKGKQE